MERQDIQKPDQEDTVLITFRVDRESFLEMERLKAFLGSPNVATALCQAVARVNQEYDLRFKGFHIMAVPDHCEALRGRHSEPHYILPLNLG